MIFKAKSPVVYESKEEILPFYGEERDDSFRFSHTEKIDDILAQCAYERTHEEKGFKRNRGFKKVATLPATLVESIKKRAEVHYGKKPPLGEILLEFVRSDAGQQFKTTDWKV